MRSRFFLVGLADHGNLIVGTVMSSSTWPLQTAKAAAAQLAAMPDCRNSPVVAVAELQGSGSSVRLG